MGRRIGTSLPSPAIFIAVLALVAALAGTAVAGPQAGTSAINKKKVKKIATKQIDKLAPGLAVDHASTADSASPTGSAGGDLNGTYPGPALANGSVDSATVENRSLRATDYTVFNGTVNVDLDSIPVARCVETSRVVPGIRATDVPIVPVPEAILSGVIVSPATGIPDTLHWFTCNLTAAPVDPEPTTFSYMVFRP